MSLPLTTAAHWQSAGLTRTTWFRTQAARRPMLVWQQRRRPAVVLAVHKAAPGAQTATGGSSSFSAALAKAAAAAAVSLLLLGAPAQAELQTISVREATENAKPLKQQPVKKGRIWLLFTLGASALFGATVVLENNEQWFPAITRANKAMKVSRKQAEQAEWEEEAAQQRLEAVQVERQDDARMQSAVLAGLAEAKQKATAAEQPSAQSSSAEAAPEEEQWQQEDKDSKAAAESSSITSAEAGPAAGEEEVEAEAASSAAAATDVEDTSATQERRVLFEISPEQIQRSVEQQAAIAQLEAELQRRKAGAASSGEQ